MALGSGREQRGGECGEHGQVHMEPDALDAPHPQRGHAPLVLQPAKLALKELVKMHT